jgi:hypothetical protein
MEGEAFRLKKNLILKHLILAFGVVLLTLRPLRVRPLTIVKDNVLI